MLRKGPRVNGAKAYAATSATTSQDGKLLQPSLLPHRGLPVEASISTSSCRRSRTRRSCPPPTATAGSNSRPSSRSTRKPIARSGWAAPPTLNGRSDRSRPRPAPRPTRKPRSLWDKMRNACSKKHDGLRCRRAEETDAASLRASWSTSARCSQPWQQVPRAAKAVQYDIASARFAAPAPPLPRAFPATPDRAFRVPS